jgi:outer membrane protein assembly factor BamB
LSPASLRTGRFHRLFSLHVDEKIETQVLIVRQVPLADGTLRDLALVCTMANSVYAFDGHDGTLLWKSTLAAPVDPIAQPGQMDMWRINAKWGISATPVVDRSTQSLYVVTFGRVGGDNTNREYRLHTLDLGTGKPQKSSLQITGRAANGGVRFNTNRQKPYQKLRAGLGLLDHAGHKALIIAFSMNGETVKPAPGQRPGHGFVFAYDVRALQEEVGFAKTPAVWTTTPSGALAGIWMAGAAPALDGDDIFFTTGNGTQTLGEAPASWRNFGESFVKLTYRPGVAGVDGGRPSLVVTGVNGVFDDKHRRQDADGQDQDLGSAGVVLAPGGKSLFGGGKDGVLYNLDRTDLRRALNLPFVATYLPRSPGANPAERVHLDLNLPTETPDGKMHHIHGAPVYWNRGPTEPGLLFVWGENERLKAYAHDLASGAFATPPFQAEGDIFASAGLGGRGGMPGGMLTLSWDGTDPASAVIWATIPTNDDANKRMVEGALIAYEANSRSQGKLSRLFHSDLTADNRPGPGRDRLGNFSKFTPPTVANGKVYVPTYDHQVVVYGLEQ